MKIELKQVTIGEIVEGYRNDAEDGVYGYDGKLNIRPKYQREFVYKEAQRNAVMDTVWKGFPLNVMYWVKNEDGTFELLDGQQRTISFCKYVAGEFMMTFDDALKGWANLSAEQQKRILDYAVQVYVCEGTDDEKLEWFKTINIAGEKLTEQEIRNAIYSGSWVTDAKRKFSKTQCVAYKLASDYMTGSPIRQDYLETVLDWITGDESGEKSKRIENYMAAHQHDSDASKEWAYFQNVFTWVTAKFTKRRKEMKGVEWGMLYNAHKDDTLDGAKLEKRIAELMKDSDVQKKSGIYAYVLDGDEHHLSIRAFDDNTKREVYEAQGGVCKICGKHFEIEQMEGDHITPWAEGGHTVKENCQMLCKECNRRKGRK